MRALFVLSVFLNGCSIVIDGSHYVTSGSDGMDAGAPAPDTATPPQPCDGACAGATPVCNASDQCVECTSEVQAACVLTESICDPSTFTCVQCLSNGDCGGDTPNCDDETHECVECLDDATCDEPAAAKCGDDRSCIPCDQNIQCFGVVDGDVALDVCDGGTCVECTPDTEVAVCGPNSCDPATRRCTHVPRSSVGMCEPCTADSECDDDVFDSDLRCVPIPYGDDAHGNYCLVDRDTQEIAVCFPRFPAAFEATSVNGVSATYCVFDYSLTTCEALLDARQSCTSDLDCGDAALATDGLCRDDGEGFYCTYRCTGASPDYCALLGPCRQAVSPSYCCTALISGDCS